MTKFKPFTTTLIGSLPRTKELLLLKESSNNSSKYEKAYKEKLLEETTKPLKDKLLNIDNQGSGFVIDQTKEFKVSFHSDQYRPYFFSRISFSVYGEAISSVYTNKL